MNDDPDLLDTSDWPDPGDDRAWVEWRTKKLRSGDPDWQPVADRLAERGFDPRTLILADLWPEDGALEIVVIVTASGDVFELEFSWLHSTRDEGTFTSCKDLTSSWRIEAYPSAAVAIALQIASDINGRAVNGSRRTDPDIMRAHVAYATQRRREPSRAADTFWKALIDGLAERGIDVMKAAEGSIYSETEGRKVNLIVTDDGVIYKYNFQFSTSDGYAFPLWKRIPDVSALDKHEQDLIDAALDIAKPR